MVSSGVTKLGSIENTYHRVEQAILLLLEAYCAASDVDADKWDFALEIAELEARGVTRSDLRWMICKGLIEHAEELEGENRQFRQASRLAFSRRSCFVLTEKGRFYAETRCSLPFELNGRQHAPPSPPAARESRVEDDLDEQDDHAAIAKPAWDPQTRCLKYGAKIVKEFKSPAANQIRLITTFDELGWPRRIDDPLPPVPDIDPKKRLHDTINAFNRNQRNQLIRFKGDGTGEGIVWELVEPLPGNGIIG